jgi:hypothetical protein
MRCFYAVLAGSREAPVQGHPGEPRPDPICNQAIEPAHPPGATDMSQTHKKEMTMKRFVPGGLGSSCGDFERVSH